MKKILKPLISVLAIGALSLSINIDKNVLANDIVNTCEYDSASKVNPDYSTMNCLLTETALKYDVPPEIVKAIAEGESGNWRHFDENGEVIVTADNGIGIMQITNQAGYDQEKLKSDLVYNIDTGVKILKSMFDRKDLPSINGGERDVLEHWYFAIMAYNGTKPLNSPIVQATGGKNSKAYQEKILGIIKKLELLDLKELPFSSEHFQYDSNSRENIKFSEMNYDFNLPLTKSKYFFETNQKVSVTTKNLREKPTTGGVPMGTLRVGEIVTVTGPFEYDEVSTKKNHFVWYPVKRDDGTEGYVASSYLNYAASTPTPVTPEKTKPASKFKDVSSKHVYYKEISEMSSKGIIRGYQDGTFKPDEKITRKHAAALLSRALDLKAGNATIKDVSKDNSYYNDIQKVVAADLISSVDGKFRPNDLMTRGEMSVALMKAYKLNKVITSVPATAATFKDKLGTYTDSVLALYNTNVTTGYEDKTFRVNDPLTRAHYAVFMYRASKVDTSAVVD